MDIRAYIALHLGGTPSQQTGTSPHSCLLLDNCLFMTEICRTENLRPVSHLKDMSLSFCHPNKALDK